jgi:hypothetical protein
MELAIKTVLFALIFSSALKAYEIKINNAPLEWLITQTMVEKSKVTASHRDHNHNTNDKKDLLVSEIFQAVDYNKEADQLIMSSSLKTFKLRERLVDFLQDSYAQPKKVSLKYLAWGQENNKNLYNVEFEKNTFVEKGHYVFNHVHTDISQDNQSLKWLKISPEKTLAIVEKFLIKRKTKGVVNFCDHDTDRSFNMVSMLANENIDVLRSIEWGGNTHMSLVGIKPNWYLLNKGRTFSGEESIIQSRSSKGFRIINHPNARKTPFKYTSWLDADGVEVWNTVLENTPFIPIGKVNPSNNLAALAQWVESLKIGKRHTAMSGTDFHFVIPCLRDHVMMYPANYIPSTKLADAKANLHRGNTSILTTPLAPKLNLRARFSNSSTWSKMGQSLNGHGELIVELTGDLSDTRKRLGSACYNTVRSFYRLLTMWKQRFWEIRFYNLQGDVIAKKIIRPAKLKKDKSFTARIKLPINDKEIVRAELWRINKKLKAVDLIGITNPIYLNRQL